MQNDEYASPVEVRNSPHHGRGLFAAVSFDAGAEIAAYPLLILSVEDTTRIQDTIIHHYVFHVDEDDQGRARTAVAFGPISMCNHSTEPNAEFTVDATAQTVTLTARVVIRRNTEILINYEEYADEIV